MSLLITILVAGLILWALSLIGIDAALYQIARVVAIVVVLFAAFHYFALGGYLR